MKVRATMLACMALGALTMAGAQSSNIHMRSNLVVASSANMERIPPAKGLNSQDNAFFKQAAIANIAEVKLGQLAQRNGSEWGQSYGKDMEREHTLALEELKKIAGEKGFSLPNDIDAKHRKAYAMLSNLHGAAFDKAYRSMMIAGHKEVLSKVQNEMHHGRDADVRGYAVTMEPAVKMHLRMAQEQTTMTAHG